MPRVRRSSHPGDQDCGRIGLRERLRRADRHDVGEGTGIAGQEVLVLQLVYHALGEVRVGRFVRGPDHLDADEQAVAAHLADRVANALALGQRGADGGHVAAEVALLDLSQHRHADRRLQRDEAKVLK